MHPTRHPANQRRFRAAYWAACFAACLIAGPASAEEAKPTGDEPQLEPIVVGTPERIEVFPAQFKLDGTRATMHLTVTGFYADGSVQDLTTVAQVTSSNEQVVKFASGRATPAGNGAAELTVWAGNLGVKVPVEVTRQDQPDRVYFNHGALVAISKQGCNSGACHGSPSGKGGFRLSLRAYDPAVDTLTLIRESYNRRTNPFEPASSLLLRKPLMEVAHGGGRKLTKTDPAYAVLHDWIAQGCQLDPPDAPSCTKLEVYPRNRILKRPAHVQQMVVLAHFSDGSIKDVTDLAVYSSSDEAVASVDVNGRVVGHDKGEAAVIVRYLEKIETSYVMFLKETPGFQWNNPPENNLVDKFVFEKLRQLQILPSDLCTDEEFVRRVHLDVTGSLPTEAVAQSFLADADPNKRAKLIDSLLEKPEFADFWALKWADLLRLRNSKVTQSGVPKFHRWLKAAFRENMPYDKFSRELLTATGSTFVNPPANFFRTAADTNDCTETTSQLFLGIRIQCAKCHNHPFERWTQDNYYGIGAFFNRVQRKTTPRADEMVVFVGRAGEVTQPRTGKQMKPWLPLKGDADLPGEDDRRGAFVDWLISADNPFFAKVEVNRIWGHLMGRGVVEPVDDFRDSNPPSSAALLDWLAQDFVQHSFDRKHVMRTILNSRTYQLSSRKNEFNKSDVKYFSHARTRLLGAEQLLDAICQVAAVPEKYAGLPMGTKAIQLPSPDVDNYFLKVFGQPARETACQCERSSESNLSQALQMINGPLVHGKIRDEKNRLRTLAAAGKSNQEIVTELYLAAFSRKPSDAEMGTAIDYINRGGAPLKTNEAKTDEPKPDAPKPEPAPAGTEKKEETPLTPEQIRMRCLEDVLWALLNANEFLFQH